VEFLGCRSWLPPIKEVFAPLEGDILKRGLGPLESRENLIRFGESVEASEVTCMEQAVKHGDFVLGSAPSDLEPPPAGPA